MKQLLLLPTKTEKVEMPEEVMDSISPEGIPQGRNFGVFYSDDLTQAVVIADLSTEEISNITKINKAKVFIKESLELETSGEIEIDNPELRVCEDFNIDTLKKRLS